MKLVNKILIFLLCGSIAVFLGYSLTKGTHSSGEVSINSLVNEIDYTISVDTEKKLVEYLEAGTTVGELLEKMPIEFIICSKDDDGSLVEKENDEKIGTGDILTVKNGDDIVSTGVYRLSVLGDVTGDGNVGLGDIEKIFNYYTEQLSEEDRFLEYDIKAGDTYFGDKSGYISVDKDSLLMIKNDKESFKYTILPSKELEIKLGDIEKLFNYYNYKEDPNYLLDYYVEDTITLSSNNESVATVTSEGVVSTTDAGDGDVNVTITLESSKGASETVGVTVADVNNIYDEIDYVKQINAKGEYNDRFFTAIKISQCLYKDGEAENVVLVDYNDYVDGYVASSLAAALDAPILLIDGIIEEDGNVIGTNSDTKYIEDVRKGISNEIKRLGATKIHIVGGKDVVSEEAIKEIVKDIENQNFVVNNAITDNVKWYSGDDADLTSIAVANAVDRLSNINSVFIAEAGYWDGTYKYIPVDAGMVAAVSGAKNIPIIYSSKTISDAEWEKLEEFLTGHPKVTTVYLVGGVYEDADSNLDDKIEEYNANIKIEYINGGERWDTNALAIEKFHLDCDGISFVNSFVDLISASRFASKTNTALFYGGMENKIINPKGEDKIEKDILNELYDSQINIVSKLSNRIKKVYVLGGTNSLGDKSMFLAGNTLYSANYSNFKLGESDKYLDDFLFNKSKAIFHLAHQGDETLYYAQTILKAIEELGDENVYVMLYSDGAASGANNDEMKAKLDSDEYKDIYGGSFMKARDAEMKLALEKLGIQQNNIYFYDVYMKEQDVYDKRLPDGQLGNHSSDIYSTLDDINVKNDYDIIHFAFLTDDSSHEDRKAIDLAAKKSFGDGFHSLELFLIDVSETSVSKEYFHTINDNNSRNIRKIDNACLQYKENSEKKTLGIGYLSSGSSFENIRTLAKNKKLKTIVHAPFNLSE